MAKFVKLTEIRNYGEPRKLQPVGEIYVNLDHIESMRRTNDHTTIHLASGCGNIIMVVETPKEIMFG